MFRPSFSVPVMILGLFAAQTAAPPILHLRREALSDLEIAGLVKNVPPGESRFVSRNFLASLPRVQAAVQHDENFPEMPHGPIKIGGIYLNVLAAALGADPETVAIAAVCSDGYTAPLPPEYIRAHRPIFVLTIDGLTPHEWALKNKAYDAGPYFITYENFVPAFRVLSHIDRAQVPSGIARLVFTTPERLFGPIAPEQIRHIRPDPTVIDGYRIARQNCYRCHNAGGSGGTKAQRSWQQLARIAKSDPERFGTWISHPQSIDPKSEMPPNPQYDRATLAALTRYFRTFASKGS